MNIVLISKTNKNNPKAGQAQVAQGKYRYTGGSTGGPGQAQVHKGSAVVQGKCRCTKQVQVAQGKCRCIGKYRWHRASADAQGSAGAQGKCRW